MLLRTARRGRSAGSRFWGCPNWAVSAECKGVTIAEDNRQALEDQGSEVVRTRRLPLPQVVAARPPYTGLETLYFESLTVPFAELDEHWDAHPPIHKRVGSQWRMSFTRGRRGQFDTATLRALSVADKILARGRITALSEKLEVRLKPANARPGVVCSSTGYRQLDSEAETMLWSSVLPEVLGPGYEMWCTPQVEIFTLTGSAEVADTEQRVDFLVAHPSLPQPLVIEIDGAQHTSQLEQDARRDAHLTAYGYRVIRVPTEEVHARDGASLNALIDILSKLASRDAYEHILSSPIRRAGQIQYALLNVMYAGVVPPSAFRVSTDLVRLGEMDTDDFNAIVADFAELLQSVARLYGASGLGDNIRAAAIEDSDVCLTFRGGADDPSAVLIEETYLPVTIAWQGQLVNPGMPVALDPVTISWFLERIFRKPKLREGQYDIVARALQAKDTVALLPTGAGKSIAFQLAGMLLPGRTIVIAPLLSLIRDQVANLRASGIDRALAITGDLGGPEERRRAYDLLTHGDALFYYIAPERFQIAEFRMRLRGMVAAHPVNLLVVDEAHCVSEWGHDFRTAYLRIGQSARECSAVPEWAPALVALTGTASRPVLKDVQRELQIQDFEALITPRSFDRKELQFRVLEEASEHKGAVLGSYLLRTLPAEFGLPASAFFRPDGNETHCGIVFCPNANGPFGVVDVTTDLARVGVRAAYYAGGKPRTIRDSQKEWSRYKRVTERKFKRNEIAVLVSTKAFGMGVDKPNVRFTVHYGIPGSIEAFYQEAGRAGRDGQTAICAVILSNDHAERNREMLAPDTHSEQVSQYVASLPRQQNDDVSRALYFHAQAFRGVTAEVSELRNVCNDLKPGGRRERRSLPYGDDKQRALKEKALHRLVVVGVVADYTINYSARSFDVLLAEAARQGVIEKYVSYVRSYQVARAIQERRKAETLSTEWDTFLSEIGELYVQFVYDIIERGRRRAVAEMLAACHAGSGEEFRKRILRYLEAGEFSEAVESILADENGGLSLLRVVMQQVLGPDDAAHLRGTVARTLESYPDNPGLLLLRAVTEALARDCELQVVAENITAFVSNARDSYGRAESEIAATAGEMINVMAKVNIAAARVLEEHILLRIQDREAIRVLIRSAGMASATLAPSLLLNRTSAVVDQWIA